MNRRLDFDATTMTSVAGGASVLDLPRLAIQTEAAADAFMAAYGFQADNPIDEKRLWYFYRRALVLLEQKLGFGPDAIPAELRDLKNLNEIKRLLLWASSQNPAERELQRWSCALLRAGHVFVHAESDLFGSFSKDIQKQILSPIQERIYSDGTSGTTFLKVPVELKTHSEHEDEVALAGFEIKPIKTSASTVIKLLAKRDAIALRVFDRVGVRFITKSLFDSYRVIRFLIEHNLVSFPHIVPDQSSNSLYPADLFCQAVSELSVTGKHLSDEDLEAELLRRLEKDPTTVAWVKKGNDFSGADYKFIKFIARKLIRVSLGEGREDFAFFFPYEIQIMDQNSFGRIQSGPSEHQSYKDRQKIAAKERLFPDLKGQVHS